MTGEVVLSAGNRRTAQLRRPRRGGFTRDRRETFLNTLAATCNVALAIKAAATCASTVYYMRRRDPEFAALWQEALTIAYERLETALLARAMGTDGVTVADADFGDPEMILPQGEIDAELALKLLARHRATVEGGRARPIRAGRHVATEAETNAALTRKLAILHRQLKQRGAHEVAALLEDRSDA